MKHGKIQKHGKVIEVKNLKKFYGRFEALKGINIELYKGEIFGFLGPNGAGKTTTLEILEGLRRPSEGEMWFLGEKIHGDVPPKIKEKIGVVLQETRFLDHLKVKEVLELFASFFKNSLGVKNVLRTVKLEEKENTYSENLSGGQKQRLAIAVSIINDPEIIFLDEPTAGLDPQSRESIWNLIEELKSYGKTIFLTTHYMEEAQRLCDRVAIIDHGQIIELGTPAELISKYGGKSEVDFECSPTPTTVALNALGENLIISGDHFRIMTQNLTKTLEALVLWSKKFDISLTNVFLIEPNLEDVFLKLTGRGLRD